MATMYHYRTPSFVQYGFWAICILMTSACSAPDDPSREESVGSTASALKADKGDKKVALCHIPPGNPTRGHTITVSTNAVSSHLAHGDALGECPSGCSSDGECDDNSLCTVD